MWEELGIAPTDDRKEIQRAYARRLRSFNPDQDPAAFQRLRGAYESALSRAAYLKKKAEADAPQQGVPLENTRPVQESQPPAQPAVVQQPVGPVEPVAEPRRAPVTRPPIENA